LPGAFIGVVGSSCHPDLIPAGGDCQCILQFRVGCPPRTAVWTAAARTRIHVNNTCTSRVSWVWQCKLKNYDYE
jgi:hypothetical protein